MGQLSQSNPVHVEKWQKNDEKTKSQQPDDASCQHVLPATRAPWDGFDHGFDFGLPCVVSTLCLGAWNYPFDLTLGPLSGAIAAGNTAIVKPSEVSAASGALMAEKLGNYIDTDAFPVFVEGPEGSSRLLKERYDIIFFTGGTHIGKIVMRAAAEHLTPVVLELGGKNPVWIDQTANFNVTASRLLSIDPRRYH